MIKSGYIEFAWLEYSVDATPVVMLRPAVAMAAEVHCQRPGRQREPSFCTAVAARQ